MTTGSSPESEQQPQDLLREWVVQISKNLNQEIEFAEWADICQREKKPTLLAAIEQFRREQAEFSKRYDDDPEVDEVDGALTASVGFDSVGDWLGQIDTIFKQSPEALSALTSGKTREEKMQDLAEALDDAKRTGMPVDPSAIEPIYSSPMLITPSGERRAATPLTKEQQEEIFKERRFLKLLLIEDPTGFKALDHHLQQERREVDQQRTEDPDSFEVEEGEATLVGMEVGVARFKQISSGIEQASWGSPNPHTTAK